MTFNQYSHVSSELHLRKTIAGANLKFTGSSVVIFNKYFYLNRGPYLRQINCKKQLFHNLLFNDNSSIIIIFNKYLCNKPETVPTSNKLPKNH